MAARTSKLSANEAQFQPLFLGALQGERKSYALLLDGIAKLAAHYVKRKLGAQAEVDDVVQEILISVHKALHTYDPARPCMPWLSAIMHYRVSDWLRARYSASQAPKVPLEDVEEFLAAPVTQDAFAYEHITKAVAHLPEGQQAVIHAMYGQELSVAETGAKLGMSVSAVKVTAHRAYKKLRKQLKEDEET